MIKIKSTINLRWSGHQNDSKHMVDLYTIQTIHQYYHILSFKLLVSRICPLCLGKEMRWSKVQRSVTTTTTCHWCDFKPRKPLIVMSRQSVLQMIGAQVGSHSCLDSTKYQCKPVHGCKLADGSDMKLESKFTTSINGSPARHLSKKQICPFLQSWRLSKLSESPSSIQSPGNEYKALQRYTNIANKLHLNATTILRHWTLCGICGSNLWPNGWWSRLDQDIDDIKMIGCSLICMFSRLAWNASFQLARH